MLKASLLALLCLPAEAWADAYKCIDRGGRISYAAVPCPPEQGEAQYQGKTTPGHYVSANEEDAKPENINKRALQVLQTSYRAKVTYKVHYLDGPAPARTPKPAPKLTPISCQAEAGVTRCSKAR